MGSGKKRICRSADVASGNSGLRLRVRISVRDGVRISNGVRRRVKLINDSLIRALIVATSADLHIFSSAFVQLDEFLLVSSC